MWLFVAWLLALCGHVAVKANINANTDFYTAAAVEYHPADGREASPAQYIENNLQAYLNFIDLAKNQNVDILVFPEATLNYLSTRADMVEYGITLPNPADKIAPWEHEEYSEVLRELSKKCKEQHLYVLVNLVEKASCDGPRSTCRRPGRTHTDGYNIYNTNVVFDRQGRIISKYQKYNLYLEPLVDEPLTPQYATFTTDFGVKFGHFICFDILFKEPAMSLLEKENVTNIAYPAMWFSELPFLTAVQTHRGWAYANNVNLISAGASIPSVGTSGSGIFAGRNQIMDAIVSPQPYNKLIVATLPKDTKPSNSLLGTEKRQVFSPDQMRNYNLSEYWADLGTFKMDIMNQTQSICAYDDICCSFDIKLKNYEIPPGKQAYKYKLAANYTTRLYGEERVAGEFYCAVLACTSDNPKSCARRFSSNRPLFNAVEFESITITAKVRYDTEGSILTMPSTLDTSILPLKTSSYTLISTKTFVEAGIRYKEFKMEATEKLSNILTFGIYGRNFNLDEDMNSRKSKKSS